MTAALPDKGRGAFTPTGKDNGSRWYEYIKGAPLDGALSSKDTNYLAVNLGVKAIQDRINSYGYSPKLVSDGYLGPKTSEAIKWIQRKLHLSDDGQAGPRTCQALWRDLVAWYAGWYGCPADQLWGMTHRESGFDPGAVGYTTPSDRGLCQINLVAHPSVSPSDAHDPWFALNYTAQRFAAGRAQFSGKGFELQRDCAIAQHNSPVAATSWYVNGTPPNSQIEAYVAGVLKAAELYR